FRQLTSLPLQSLAARSPNPPVGVHLLLLIGFPFPLPRTSLRLGNVAAAVGLVQILQHGSAVVTLVRYGFFDAAQVDLRLFRWSRHGFVLHQLRDRFARFCQSLVNGRRVSWIGPLQRHRQQSAAGQVHCVFCLMCQVGAAILHLGDPGIGIIRVFPFLIGPLLLRLRSNRAPCSRGGSRSPPLWPNPPDSHHISDRCPVAPGFARPRWPPASSHRWNPSAPPPVLPHQDFQPPPEHGFVRFHRIQPPYPPDRGM